MDIRMDFGSLEILEKVAARFGNGAHIVVPRKFASRKVKIISGNSIANEKTIRIDLFHTEIVERKVTSFGTGAHIVVPRKYSDKKVKIIVGDG